MAEDGEVLRQLWDSYLPVAFHLSSNDLHAIKDPEPYYVRTNDVDVLCSKNTSHFAVNGASAELLHASHRQGGRLLLAVHRLQRQVGGQPLAGLSRRPAQVVSFFVEFYFCS